METTRKGCWEETMKMLLGFLLIPTAIMFFCCNGCPSSREEVKKKLDNADVLWDSDKKSDAVMEYRKVYEDSRSDEKERILPRMVEFEVKASNTDEAKKWIKRGLEDNLKVEYTDPATKKLFVVAKNEYDEAAEKKRKDLEAKYRVDELWDSGKQEIAVKKYDEMYDKLSNSDKALVVKRAYEYAVKRDDWDLAQVWESHRYDLEQAGIAVNIDAVSMQKYALKAIEAFQKDIEREEKRKRGNK